MLACWRNRAGDLLLLGDDYRVTSSSHGDIGSPSRRQEKASPCRRHLLTRPLRLELGCREQSTAAPRLKTCGSCLLGAALEEE